MGERRQTQAGFGHPRRREVDQLALAVLLDLPVELGLRRGQLDPQDLLEARGEFRGDRPLGPPQQVGRRLPAQPLVVPRAFLGAEAGGQAGQVAGKQEFEQRAQVPQGVLQRGTGEEEPRARPQGTERGRTLGTSVLDVLGLVRHHARELYPGEKLLVAGEGAVAGDQEIGPRQFSGGRQAAGAVMHRHAQARGEPRGLPAPVLEQRGGTDDERRADRCRVRAMGRGEEGERLQGLPQAHLVREDPAEALAVQVPQPRHPEPLVRAQQRVEAGGHRRGLEGGQAFDRPGEALPLRRGTEARRDILQQLRDLGHPAPRHPLARDRGHRRPWVGGQGLLGARETDGEFRVDQEHPPLGLEITPPRRERGPELGLGSAFRGEPEFHAELVAGGLHLRGQPGGHEVRGLPCEGRGEARGERAPQPFAVPREEREGAVPVAQPPPPVGRLQQEARFLDQPERLRVLRVFPRGQGQREVVLGAVDLERPEPFRGPCAGRAPGGRRSRGRRRFAQEGVVPPGARGAALHKNALARRRAAEFAQLPPVQLQHARRLRSAPTLQQG